VELRLCCEPEQGLLWANELQGRHPGCPWRESHVRRLQGTPCFSGLWP